MALRDEIIKEQVESLNKSLSYWRAAETASEVLADIFTLNAALSAFSNTYFKIEVLNWVSGSSSIIALAAKRFESYCNKQGQAGTVAINKLLVADGEKPIPDISMPLPERAAMLAARRDVNKQ